MTVVSSSSELGEQQEEFPVLHGVLRDLMSRARRAHLDGPRLCDNAVLGVERLLELLCPGRWRSSEHVLRQLLDLRCFDGWKEPVARVLLEGHNVERPSIRFLMPSLCLHPSTLHAAENISFVLRVTR